VALLIIVLTISYIVLGTATVNSSQTNAKPEYYGRYDYSTTYAGLTYVNKFSVNVTSVSRNTISFLYDQTEAANSTIAKESNNFSLAFNPSNPSTFEAGSALPLFVASHLSTGNGTALLATGGSNQPLPVNYTVSISNLLTRIDFRIVSGTQGKQTIVSWYLEYNETTGFLVSGFASVTSQLIAYSTFNYTLTYFAE
jgi:hypothetical protein